ncbi:MAG: DUF6714 family protein [Cyanobacteriota bacterium]|nr:DUF6714 family protein [Cyanobacteriota bacterium]
MNAIESQLIGRIQNAFRDVKLGNGISLNMTEYYDSYGYYTDFAEKAKYDEREDWSLISDSTLEEFTVTFAFTDIAGFRFYLPAYMTWTIKNHRANNSIVGDYTIYALDTEHYLFKEVGFISAFSSEQMACIIDFLDYCIQNDRSCDGLVAKENLAKIYQCLEAKKC